VVLSGARRRKGKRDLRLNVTYFHLVRYNRTVRKSLSERKLRHKTFVLSTIEERKFQRVRRVGVARRAGGNEWNCGEWRPIHNRDDLTVRHPVAWRQERKKRWEIRVKKEANRERCAEGNNARSGKVCIKVRNRTQPNNLFHQCNIPLTLSQVSMTKIYDPTFITL